MTGAAYDPALEAFVLRARVDRMADEIERLRGWIDQAVAELDAEHRDGDLVDRGRHGGCVICWPRDGSWPCVSRMIADDLRACLTT